MQVPTVSAVWGMFVDWSQIGELSSQDAVGLVFRKDIRGFLCRNSSRQLKRSHVDDFNS